LKRKLRLASGLILAVIATPHSSMATQHELAPIDSSVAEHMHGHLSRVRAMKAFVIAGQLDGLREPAVWLAEHDTAPGLPVDWIPYVVEMRRYAREAASARHLVFAAASVSEMARTCGDCHRAGGISITFGDEIRPPNNGGSVRAQMQRHLWAADRMWEALIGPSDSAWDEATGVLAEVQLTASDIGAAAGHEPQVAYLLRRSSELGEEGAQAKSRQSRSAVYGEFLSLCADCHSMTVDGPGTPQ
jgi:cytochrome c553